MLLCKILLIRYLWFIFNCFKFCKLVVFWVLLYILNNNFFKLNLEVYLIWVFLYFKIFLWEFNILVSNEELECIWLSIKMNLYGFVLNIIWYGFLIWLILK